MQSFPQPSVSTTTHPDLEQLAETGHSWFWVQDDTQDGLQTQVPSTQLAGV